MKGRDIFKYNTVADEGWWKANKLNKSYTHVGPFLSARQYLTEGGH